MLDIINFIISIWDYIKPYVVVLEYEEGVMFTFGKYTKTLKPGLHFKWFFAQTYHLENVKNDTFRVEDVNITTLDNKTISIGCEFDFTIEDIVKATVEQNEWRSNLKDICIGILSDHLEDCTWEDIKKKTVKNQIDKKIQKRALEMGVATSNFNFTNKAISRAFKIFK